ncbi:MAG: hypothetical protein HY887_04200, partial [Deltaproteobacteria bacterium]|nr:hypothetical protein [Deltaproteobacteria bacterium]
MTQPTKLSIVGSTRGFVDAKSIVLSLSVLLASIIIWRISLHNASATGGAFPYTKHGGGATDGETPCAGGVNRGLGADYGGNCTNAVYYD